MTTSFLNIPLLFLQEIGIKELLPAALIVPIRQLVDQASPGSEKSAWFHAARSNRYRHIRARSAARHWRNDRPVNGLQFS